MKSIKVHNIPTSVKTEIQIEKYFLEQYMNISRISETDMMPFNNVYMFIILEGT